MRNSVFRRVLSTLGLATGLLVTALVALADHAVPFKGTCYGVYVSEDDPDYGHIGVRVHGNSTLLGEFTGIIYGNSQLILWAANGDELWGDLSSYPFQLTSGTGRFEGAIGSWTLTPVESYPDGFFHLFSGEVSCPGSNGK